MEREELNHAAYGARLLQEAGNPAALARASRVA
jgi:hypothetical protein